LASSVDKHRLSHYGNSVIASFKHRGLKRLYADDDHRGLSPAHVDKIKRILVRLDEAVEVRNIAIPGFGLHPLKGKLRGKWAVSGSGNWRIVFRFDSGKVYDVDLIDYH
jgi:proteic killer suppression protein